MHRHTFTLLHSYISPSFLHGYVLDTYAGSRFFFFSLCFPPSPIWIDTKGIGIRCKQLFIPAARASTHPTGIYLSLCSTLIKSPRTPIAVTSAPAL